ncbi:MAG: ATP-dependent DNA helicase, partial [Ectothiorhodospiraceae bacterium]|nr:ATP-dependent DNA helicase [Ectothiorhodospiraceae bacterium]
LIAWPRGTYTPAGRAARAAASDRLEGFPWSAGAWEQDVLPGRVADYAPHMLDQLLASGRFVWLRLVPPRIAAEEAAHRPGPLRSTPIALLEREALTDWRAAAGGPAPGALKLSPGAGRVCQTLEEKGAMFFTDLVSATRMLRTQVEEALGELVTWGLVTSDTYNGLRALIAPAHKRPSFGAGSRRRGRRTAPGVDAAGRWALLPAPERSEANVKRGFRTDMESLEHIAWVLLQRYGVVFRRVLEREQALPPWRELLYVYRRLEARDEIRGGRFVQQFSGEQFALPEAVGALKAMGRREPDATRVAVSAADPLNLLGVLTPGSRLPAVAGNRLLYRDGVPEAILLNGEVRFLESLSAATQWQVQEQLRRHAAARVTPAPRPPSGGSGDEDSLPNA